MSLPFFYEPYESNQPISLSDSNMHYILHVLRMQAEEECWIVNGKGIATKCKLVNVSKRSCNIEIIESKSEILPSSNLHLGISFTKNAARIEWLLEKITEIGIASISPLITKRSERIHFKKERFEKILISAMLQSQQSILPLLHEPITIQDIVKTTADIKLIAWCDEHTAKKPITAQFAKDKNTLILIGPEGDFTQEEVDLCINNGFKPVSLGNNRLRTETAGLYSVVVYNASK